MRKKYYQLSLSDIYEDVSSDFENREPTFIDLLDEYIDFSALIPDSFYRAFYSYTGRKRVYSLESFIRYFTLKTFLGIDKDSVMLSLLSLCKELFDFCDFPKVPDAAKITRFKQSFHSHIKEFFEHLVDFTEPICRELDEKKSDYLLFDTTGFEVRVAENNPKFFNSKLKYAKSLQKSNANYNPYAGVYSLLPDFAENCPDAKQQYINGHFCYAVKAGVITNGLGIVRGIQIFDDEFRSNHPDIVEHKSDNPDIDKEIGDSTSLKPILSDFYTRHPDLSYKTFIGDSSFDSYDIYSMLKNEFHFERACIPINPRNSVKSENESTSDKPSPVPFNESGIPLCPKDKAKFISLGKSKGKHRSSRFKFVCPKSVPHGKSRICTCDNPCTPSTYGRCVYTYPDKDFRMYPGILRDDEHWDNLYRHRVKIERTINILKDTLGTSKRLSLNVLTLKVDIYLAGIVHLLGVILAKAIHKPHLFKSIRKLVAA